jgi:hypothetical protein
MESTEHSAEITTKFFIPQSVSFFIKGGAVKFHFRWGNACMKVWIQCAIVKQDKVKIIITWNIM